MYDEPYYNRGITYPKTRFDDKYSFLLIALARNTC